MSDADVNVDNNDACRAGAQMLQRRADVGLVHPKNIRGRRARIGHERRRQERREDVGPGEALGSPRVELRDRGDGCRAVRGWGIWKMHASKPEGPLYANSLMYLALSMKKAGRSKEAVEVIKAAARAKGLNPDTSIFPGMVARRAAALAAGELGK